MPNKSNFRQTPRTTDQSGNKSKSRTSGSKRARDKKPERRMSAAAFAAMLKRMTKIQVDPLMKAFDRAIENNKILKFMKDVDGYITMEDGSRLSTTAKQYAEGILRDVAVKTVRKITSKGSTETAAGAEAIFLPSPAALWRSQRALPVGSVISEHSQIGRPSVPRGRGFNPVSIKTYRSEQRGDSSTSFDLFKAPAFRQDASGINEIYSTMIPLEPSEINMRRLSLMSHPNISASNTVSDDRVEEFWDTPTDPDIGTMAGSRSSYFPYSLGAKYKLTNLNEVLNCTVKISLVQLRGPLGFSSGFEVYQPDTHIETCLEAMPVQSKILNGGNYSPVSRPLANAYADQADKGTQAQWGYTETEFEEREGAYTFLTRKSIKSSPRYKNQFNELYTTSCAVGAGSSFEYSLTHNINRCFSHLGNLADINAGNRWTSPAVFMLVEVSGRKDTNYYRAFKPAGGEITRTFSSGTGPVVFAQAFDTSMEFCSEDQPITQSGAVNSISGFPYIKSYLNVENQTNVSEIINEPFSSIIQQETELVDDVSSIIVPVKVTGTLQGSSIRKV